ncbi:MAG TPA: Tautomerase enzyme [Mogibacterium sp.]|nr:Tautomerase enzyme [Mogibacterium sp.]
MPHITISMYPGRSDEVKKEMARNTKEYFVKLNGVPESSVSVSIEEVSPDVFETEMTKRLNENNVLVEPSNHLK